MREEYVSDPPSAAVQQGTAKRKMSTQRILAIVEREMRKYLRSPVLVLLTTVLPLPQLVILGNSFGGKIQGARIALIDCGNGPEARRVRESLQSVEYDATTFELISYASEKQVERICGRGGSTA